MQKESGSNFSENPIDICGISKLRLSKKKRYCLRRFISVNWSTENFKNVVQTHKTKFTVFRANSEDVEDEEQSGSGEELIFLE